MRSITKTVYAAHMCEHFLFSLILTASRKLKHERFKKSDSVQSEEVSVKVLNERIFVQSFYRLY